MGHDKEDEHPHSLPASAEICMPWSRAAPAPRPSQSPRTAATSPSRTTPLPPLSPQIEPLLEKIDPQHLFQLFRPSPVARLGLVRLDQCAQPRPWHHLLHLIQTLRPPCLLRVSLESRHRQSPLFADSVQAGTTLSRLPVEREQSVSSLEAWFFDAKVPLFSLLSFRCGLDDLAQRSPAGGTLVVANQDEHGPSLK
jgi:hypothetical protein